MKYLCLNIREQNSQADFLVNTITTTTTTNNNNNNDFMYYIGFTN